MKTRDIYGELPVRDAPTCLFNFFQICGWMHLAGLETSERLKLSKNCTSYVSVEAALYKMELNQQLPTVFSPSGKESSGISNACVLEKFKSLKKFNFQSSFDLFRIQFTDRLVESITDLRLICANISFNDFGTAVLSSTESFGKAFVAWIVNHTNDLIQ